MKSSLLLFPREHSGKRDFYAEMCRVEGWNVRTLHQKIDAYSTELPPRELLEKELHEAVRVARA